MASSEQQAVPLTIRAGTRAAAVLVPFFLFVWLAVDTRLVYFWPTRFFPAYRLGTAFAGGLLAEAGGPVRYAAALLSQFYYYPWAGALVLTAVVASLCGVAWLYLAATMGRRPALLHWVPLLLVLALAVRYAHHLDALLAVVVAAFAAWVYVRRCRRGVWLPLGLFAALSSAVHYVAGAAVLLFALLCVLAELGERRWTAAAFCAACGGLLPWVVARWVVPTRPRFAYSALLWFGPGQEPDGRWLVASLYGFWPVAMALLAVLATAGRWWGRKSDRTAGRRAHRARARWCLGTALMLAAGATTAWYALDRNGRTLRRIELCSRTEQWGPLLEAAAHLPPEHYVLAVSWDVNRALCQKGLMGERMFAWPQHMSGLLPHPLAFPEGQNWSDASLEMSDAFMDLGHANATEHLTYQAMEIYGEHPYILQRLALTALGRGETAAGRVLLNVLDRDLIYGAWARRMLADLARDPSLAGRPEVQRLRSCRATDDFVGWFPLATILRRLLDANARNRTALEYMMAELMLTGRLERLAKEMPRLAELGYSRIPRHWEEALLIFEAATGEAADLGGYTIRPETRRRFEAFARARAVYGANRVAAAQALAPGFGDSYFFHNAFRMGGGAGRRGAGASDGTR